MLDINAFGLMFSKAFFCLFEGITVTLATAAPQILRPLVPSAEGIAAILMQVLVARIHKLDLEQNDPSRNPFPARPSSRNQDTCVSWLLPQCTLFLISRLATPPVYLLQH